MKHNPNSKAPEKNHRNSPLETATDQDAMREKNEEDQETEEKPGFAGLPHPWSTAVQLVGTFGLAVFLVLYYVLVMYPQDRARYDELKNSVESLIAVVEKGQTLLTTDQSKRLESLFILGVANEIGVFIHDELQKGSDSASLLPKIDSMILRRTEWIEGFTQKGGRNISESIVHRIAEPGELNAALSQELPNMKTMSIREVSNRCQEILEFSFAERRMAK